MITPLKLIAFDLDGTLYFNDTFIDKAYEKAIQRYERDYNKKIPIPTLDEILHQIGNPIPVILKNLFHQLSQEEIDQVAPYLTEETFNAVENKEGRVANGLEKVLQQLKKKGYFLAIASNGRKEYIDKVLEAHHLVSYFIPPVSLDDKTRLKKSDILQHLLNQYRLTPQEMLMVGDRKSDVEAAKKVGCRIVGCVYGFQSKEELQDADYAISSIKELPNIINQFFEKHKE